MKKIVWLFATSLLSAQIPTCELTNFYSLYCQLPSDIYEHLPTLRRFASECSSAIELGVRDMVSTWAILQGLAENPHHPRFYLGVDLSFPPEDHLLLGYRIANENNISFQVMVADDLTFQVSSIDLLFIDALHKYAQLTCELETFAPNTNKYIIMHDTSGYFENNDDDGDLSKYPPSVDRNKRGLWPAVVDFLHRHPEWILQERHLNNNGLTVLRRL